MNISRQIKDIGYSLYIHVPFCVHKCPYCDFNTFAVSKVPGASYVEALVAELDYRLAQPQWEGRPVNTIFFGGGTPSLLEPALIQKMLDAVRSRTKLRDGCEISLEANPGQASRDFLLGYHQAGVNRISFGAQSFSQKTLKTLGRLHTPADIACAFSDARSSGFSNLNIDIIYGVPGQNLSEFNDDLTQALQLSPEHVSLYGLTIEQGTPFHSAVARKDIIPSDDETALSMMYSGIERLIAAGFEHYEVSNFAKPSFHAQHNLAYWNGDDYLGLGAGAHSFIRTILHGTNQSGMRWSNVSLPEEYSQKTRAKGTAESWQDTLGLKELVFEYFFLGLRKRKGASISGFETQFGFSVNAAYPGLLTVLCGEGLMQQEGDFVSVSNKGLALSDSVIENFSEPILS